MLTSTCMEVAVGSGGQSEVRAGGGLGVVGMGVVLTIMRLETVTPEQGVLRARRPLPVSDLCRFKEILTDPSAPMLLELSGSVGCFTWIHYPYFSPS